MTNPSSLSSQLYKARYFPYSSFFNARLGSNPSFTWRSIDATKDLLQKHSRLWVRNGTGILVTTDPWLLEGDSSLLHLNFGDLFATCTVNQLMVPG